MQGLFGRFYCSVNAMEVVLVFPMAQTSQVAAIQ